ncbi:MAG: aspartyl/asparaginyl beta-hydroxylase domain-containing protein [Acidobacteriota bacterium]
MNWLTTLPHLEARHWVLLVFVASALHAHLRGKVRFGWLRALTDFTVLIAPFNSLMVLFSKVGSQAYLDPKDFPELKVLQDNWQMIREEALSLDGDGQRYHWKDGEVVMFDETYIHFAENATQHPRIILFADVERPVYTPIVRWINHLFARVVMTASATQNVEGERIGALNRFFGYAYGLRVKAKALKQTNRTAYYIGKWVLIGGLLAWLFVV